MPRKKRKKNQWVKWRHKPVRLILAGFVGAYVRIKSGVKVEKLKNSNKRQYLIIMNHTTAFDQFFIGMAFKQPVYYIASEDLFSNGFVSKLLSYFLAPIPIKKQTTDIKAVRDCLRVAKEGGTIALAPEGNRSFSGKTGYFKPSIASLAATEGYSGLVVMMPIWSTVCLACGVSILLPAISEVAAHISRAKKRKKNDIFDNL